MYSFFRRGLVAISEVETERLTENEELRKEELRSSIAAFVDSSGTWSNGCETLDAVENASW